MNIKEIVMTWKALCIITAIGACIGLAVVNMGFTRPPQSWQYYWYPERFFTGLFLGGGIAFLAGVLLKTVLQGKSTTTGKKIGFHFTTMRRFFFTLRHFSALQNKRNYILAIGLPVIAALLLAFILVGRAQQAPIEATEPEPTPTVIPAEVIRELQAKLLDWHYDESACGQFPNGLKVDSAKWRFTGVDSGKVEWEAEAKFLWNGQETLSAPIFCFLLDGNGYQISQAREEISMPPRSVKIYKFRHFSSITGSEELTPELARTVVRMELRAYLPKTTEKAQREAEQKAQREWEAQEQAQREREAKEQAEQEKMEEIKQQIRKDNWRSLKKGMSKAEVRRLLGEPDSITVSSVLEWWSYKGGRVTFFMDKLDSWSEPSWER